MIFIKRKRSFQVWKSIIVAQFAMLLFSCQAPDTSLGNKKNIKTDDSDTPQKVVAVITAADGEELRAKKFASKGYTDIEFKKVHKVTKIGVGAFKGNKLTKLDLPEGIVSIGKDAFMYNRLVVGR